MKISGASVKGGIQDLFVSLTREEKQEEVMLPNKRCCSVGWSHDPIQHCSQNDTENDDTFSYNVQLVCVTHCNWILGELYIGVDQHCY